MHWPAVSSFLVKNFSYIVLRLIQLCNKTEQFGYKSGYGMCASKHLKCYNIKLVMRSFMVEMHKDPSYEDITNNQG